MTVKELIEELRAYPQDLPISINDCMDFSESIGDTIEVSRKQYIRFPFTDKDRFDYINLEVKDKEYWDNI